MTRIICGIDGDRRESGGARMEMRTRVLLAISLLFVVACGAPSNPAAHNPQSEQRATGEFWQLMNQQSLDYEYFETLEALWNVSDVALIGHLTDIKNGRGLGGRKGELATAETVIAKFKVDEVVRGDLAEDSKANVDIELFKSSLVAVEDLAEAAPSESVLILLQRASPALAGVEIDESGAQRDPGKTLYLPPTTKGLFIELEDDIATPLDTTPGPFEESIKAMTLEELAEEIRSF
jgi:hypothetical protein